MKTYTRRALSLVSAIALLITCGISGLVLPAAADPATDVVYSEDFQSADHGWTLSGATSNDAVADGETNKAFTMAGTAKHALSPKFDVALEVGDKYLLRLKMKATSAADTQDKIMLFFYNTDAKDGSPQGATISVKSGATYTSTYYTIPTDGYMYIQHPFYVKKAATQLQVGAYSVGGKFAALIDDVEVIKVDNETNFAPGGDFEGDKSMWFADFHSNRGAVIIEESTDNKALQVNATGNTYLRMNGLEKNKQYEVKFRYKGAFADTMYAAGCKEQVITNVKKTASTEWREYHAYIATSDTNVGYLCFRPSVGLLIDDVVVREITISLPETNTVKVGNTLTLTPTVQPTLEKAPKMTWESSDTATATVADGVVTGVAAGEATITIKNAAGKVAATTTVTVEQGATATGIVLNKTTAELEIGDTVELTASAIPEDASLPSIIWSSSDNEIATVADGVVTAVKAGTVTITATAGDLSATCTVTVKADDGNLFKNGDLEGDGHWSASDYIQAGVGKDSSTGIKIETTVAEGATDNNIKGVTYGKLLGKLQPNTTYKFTFEYKHEGVGFGQLYMNSAFGALKGGAADSFSNKSFSLTGGTIDWKTYEFIFTTPEKLGQDNGILVRQVQYKNQPGTGAAYYDNFKIVELPKATSVTISNTAVNVIKDKTFTLSLVAEPENSTIPTVTWTSSDEEVATVAGGVVTGLKTGTATITATPAGLTAVTCTVTVVEDMGNLIVNGDFEQGAAVAWGSSVRVKPGVGKDGSWGLESVRTEPENEYKDGPGSYYNLKLLGDMSAKKLYILSFDYKNTGGGKGQVYFAQNFGTTTEGKELKGQLQLPAGEVDWTHCEYYFTTPDSITKSDGWEILFRSVGTAGTTWYDNISIIPAPTATSVTMSNTTAEVFVGKEFTLSLIANPEKTSIPTTTWKSSDDEVATVEGGVVTGIKEGTVTITATPEGLEPVTCTINVVKDDGSLIINGNFEQGASVNWGNNAAVQAGVGKDGSWGLASVRTEEEDEWKAGPGPYYKELLLDNMEPNTVYILSFDYKNTGSGRGQVYFVADFGTSADGKTAYKNKALDMPAGEVDWTHIEYYFTTPEKIKPSMGYELLFRSRGLTGTSYFDNIKLIPAPKAESVTANATSARVKEGKTFTIVLTSVPEKTTIPTVTWTTSNAEVATVENGVITGLKAGTAVITATPAGLAPVTCDVTVVEDDGNLIENGDFEQGSAIAWGNSAYVQAGVGKDGSYGMKLHTTVVEGATKESAASVWYKDPIISLLEPDTIYTLTVDVKHEGKGHAALYTLSDVTFGNLESGKAFSGTFQVSSGDKDWTTYTMVFSTPSAPLTAKKGTELMLRQIQYATYVGDGCTYFDNLKIVKTGTVQHAEEIYIAPDELELLPYESGLMKVMTKPADTATGIITWESSDPSKVTVDKDGNIKALVANGEVTITATNDKGLTATAKVVVREDANIIKNGDFEQGGKFWNDTINVKPGIGKDGSYGFELTKKEGASSYSTYYYKESFTAMSPNTTYILTFDYYKTKGSSWRFWTSSLGFGNMVSMKNDAASKWHSKQMIFTTPAEFALNKGWDFAIVVDSDGTYNAAVVDNVVLRKYNTGVDAESITLSKSEVTIIPGRTTGLSVFATPENGDLNDMIWTSSNDNVAIVEYGVVTGVGKGTATITAKTKNGKTATCKVTVSGDEVYAKNPTFDIKDDTSWVLADGAELVEGEGSVGTNAIKLTKGASVTQTMRELKPETLYQIRVKSRTSKSAAKVIVKSGDTVLYEGKTKAVASSFSNQVAEFTTPAKLGKDTTVTVVMESDGWILIDNVILNIKASLIDFVVNDLFWVGGGYQVVPGTELTFAATVVNQGTDPVKVGQVVELDICKNGESFMTLSQKVTKEMGKGDSIILSAEEPWVAEAGHWVVSARANAALSILELDDTNNSTQKNLRVDENILTAPQPALDAEMTDLTFSDEFNSRDSIDQYATGKDGYKWYVTRPYGKPNTEPDDYEITDGIIKLMAKEGGFNITLSTLDLNTEVGYTWNKGYLEVRFKITKPDSTRYGGPAIWSFPDTKVLEIPGQNRKWVEMDWMEYWGITKARPGGYYTITFHDELQNYENEPNHWYSNGNASKEGLGDGEWHTMGWLWVENAVIAYMDGEECFRMQFSETGVPSCKVNVNEGSPEAEGVFSYINEQFNALFIGGHRDHPMEVDYVHIWQGGTGSIDLPDLNGGDEDGGSQGGLTVDAFTWWYNYCTDIYGDNITEVTYENFLTVLGADSVDGEYSAMLLWEQLTAESKAAINEMLIANGQPTFEELLAAALAMAELVKGGWTPEQDLPEDQQPEQELPEGDDVASESDEPEDVTSESDEPEENTSESDEPEDNTSESDEPEEKPEDNAPTGATTALPIAMAAAVVLSAVALWFTRKQRTNA